MHGLGDVFNKHHDCMAQHDFRTRDPYPRDLITSPVSESLDNTLTRN